MGRLGGVFRHQANLSLCCPPGLLHHKGDKTSFSSRFGQGSIIGVHLDTWHGTLTFFKNRKCIGEGGQDPGGDTCLWGVAATEVLQEAETGAQAEWPQGFLRRCPQRKKPEVPGSPEGGTAQGPPEVISGGCPRNG